MYSWTMKDVQEWNNDVVIVPSDQNEQFEGHGNKLKVVVPSTLTYIPPETEICSPVIQAAS